MRSLRWGRLALLAACLTAGVARADISFVAAGTSCQQSTGSNCSPGTPANIQNNDILILTVYSPNAPSITVDNGYTLKVSTATANGKMEIHWKRTTGTESSTTCTRSGDNGILCTITAWRGVVTTGDPFDVLGTITAFSAATTISTASVTTVTNNAMVMHYMGSENDNTWGTYTGTPTNEAFEFATSATSPDSSCAMSYGVKATAGSTGAAGATQSNSDLGDSVQFAIKPQVDTVPGTPGTPTFTNVRKTTLRVSWTAATNATSYKIERAPDVAGSPGTFVQIAGGVTNLFYDDSGLTGSTTYWYRVRGTNGAGDGSYSGNASVTTAAADWTSGYQRYGCWAPDGPCFAVNANGGRIDFGAGANDHASSDGTTVTFAGPISVASCTGCGGGGTAVLKYTSSFSVTWGSLAANACETLTATAVPNAAVNDAIWCSSDRTNAYKGFQSCFATAANSVSIRNCNMTASAQTGGSGTVKLTIIKAGGLTASGSVDFASFAANTCQTTTITVTGATDPMACVPQLPSAFPANLVAACWVSSANTASLRVCNPSASSVADPASMTYGVRLLDKPHEWGSMSAIRVDIASVAANAVSTNGGGQLVVPSSQTASVYACRVPHAQWLSTMMYHCYGDAGNSQTLFGANMGGANEDPPIADYALIQLSH